MIVVDASVLIELLLRLPEADPIEERLLAPEESLHAPYLLDIEVAQVVRNFVRAREVSPDDGAAALFDLTLFPLNRHRHDYLLSRIWDLRDNFTAYDAAYVALAENLDAPLMTRDRRLAAAAQGIIDVELI